LNDADPDIAAAGRLWAPTRWFLVGKNRRREWAAAEELLRADPEKWQRYSDLVRELKAWNWIESSIVLAVAAGVYGIVALFTS
jgi:hypothetical protein